MIKLLILDIDGVMTDGTKVYGLDGLTIGKRYCDRDFTAIKQFKAAGVQVCFLSGDDKVNKAMAENRKTDFYYSRGREKTDYLEEFADTYNCSTKEMAYVGDDIFELFCVVNLFSSSAGWLGNFFKTFFAKKPLPLPEAGTFFFFG